ncbi:hypothetical protein DL239_15430 [Sedimentitalea sp. CY04]|uniref:MarR family transcriptional regulator n=1 Tax=Parasedimentitalea denitrificans TaxID=2211118 RepID=A0ABX0W9M2_9RHOB|nr:hypothetical protein [Sedimentitalea sp. CY04]NIZ62363.1 hypothetical protein [Sedimentitalea sp. CY04]
MSKISKLAELRKLMLEMERSIGLLDLSPVERDIYYAATDLSNALNGVRTTDLLDHKLVVEVSRPTFFRALKSLVSRGYLIQAQETGRGQYTVKSLD